MISYCIVLLIELVWKMCQNFRQSLTGLFCTVGLAKNWVIWPAEICCASSVWLKRRAT